MKILVTGSQGFIGSRLLPALGAAGHDARGPELNLLDLASIESAVRTERWDAVIHLAAMSHVPSCEKSPEQAYQTNLAGTALLLESLRRHCRGTHFLFASTAQVYAGAQASSAPWDEERPIAPQNLYARTKRAAELLIADAASRGEIRATVLRIFNHTHRTQSPEFFLPHVYAELKGKSAGAPARLSVGNLDLYRDIGSVQDLTAALTRALELPNRGGCEIYNLCSGTRKHLATLARLLAERLRVQAEFVTDPARVRPGEPREIIGSCAKFSRATEWKPACATENDLVTAFLED